MIFYAHLVTITEINSRQITCNHLLYHSYTIEKIDVQFPFPGSDVVGTLTGTESRRLCTANISWVAIQPPFCGQGMLMCLASSAKCDSLKKLSDFGLDAWMPFSRPA